MNYPNDDTLVIMSVGGVSTAARRWPLAVATVAVTFATVVHAAGPAPSADAALRRSTTAFTSPSAELAGFPSLASGAEIAPPTTQPAPQPTEPSATAAAPPPGSTPGPSPSGARAVVHPRPPAPEQPPPAPPVVHGSECEGPLPDDPAFYDEMLRNRPEKWLSGDTTNHIDLAPNRVLWLFGDSWWGSLRADGSYAPGYYATTNSVFLQTGPCVGVLRAGRNFVDPPAGVDFYWPTDGWVRGPDLFMAFLRVVRTGPGGFDFRTDGTDLIRLDAGTFAVEHRARLSHAPFDWGTSIERVGDTLYLWGRSANPEDRRFFLARAHVDRPTALEFRSVGGWTTDHARAIPVHDDPTNASFHQLPDGRWMATWKDSEFHGDGIIADLAQDPWGPWTDLGRVATASPRTQGAGEFTYMATLHPGIGWDNGRMLLMWSHNTIDLDRVLDGTVEYLPTYTSVSPPGVLDGVQNRSPVDLGPQPIGP